MFEYRLNLHCEKEENENDSLLFDESAHQSIGHTALFGPFWGILVIGDCDLFYHLIYLIFLLFYFNDNFLGYWQWWLVKMTMIDRGPGIFLHPVLAWDEFVMNLLLNWMFQILSKEERNLCKSFPSNCSRSCRTSNL